jgi:acyl-CoA synthetase (AMP-forming)/AMP-acid ligase II
MAANTCAAWSVDPTATTLLPEHIHAMADAYGDREAVLLADEVLTFRDVERQSAALARGLLARGVGKGNRIGILLSNGPRFVVWWAAIVRIGAVVVPISTFVRSGELARAIRAADLHGLVFQSAHLRHRFVPDLEAGLPTLAGSSPDIMLAEAPYLRWAVQDGEPDPEPAPAPSWAREAAWLSGTGVPDNVLTAAEHEVHGDDTAMIVLTSGQSAAPKGVFHTQAAITSKVHYLRSMLGYTADRTLMANMPFFWVGGLVMSLLTGMEIGARVVCQDATTYRLAAPIGATASVSPTAELMADCPPPNIASLGMTETFGMYSWGRERVVPAYPLCAPLDYFEPGYTVEVIDADGAPVPDGSSGEIAIRGPTVTRQLLKVPRSACFTEDGFYRTGDRGLRNGDRIHFLGRLGDMIKTSGANVAPPEVEHELIGLPGVAAAYVVDLPDPDRGSIVVAAVVCEPGAEVGPDQIRAGLKERLSSFKVPRYVEMLEQSEVPMTPSQKLDRRAFRELMASRTGSPGQTMRELP